MSKNYKWTATPNVTCQICGKQFHLKPSHIPKAKTHCCSRKCFAELKKITFCGENNHQYGLKGNANLTWKSDYKETSYGYLQVRVLDHPFRDKSDFVFEHRIVAEKYFLTDENSVVVNGKRYLKPEYVVHHKNFDRKDNRPENLAVMTKEEHSKLHSDLNKRERNEEGQFMKQNGTVLFKFVTKTAIMPKRANRFAAGYDLFVDTESPVTIQPGDVYMFSTGIAVQMPPYCYAEVFSRSGISARRGLVIATGVSVIDNDYRGDIRLPIRNLSNEPQTIEPHERVAQLVFIKGEQFTLEVVNQLDDTERGSSGFGSTGR